MASDTGGVADRASGRRGPFASLSRWAPTNRSPLTRKIVAFNVLAMLILVAGILATGPFRDSSILQREAALIGEATLVTGAFEAQLMQSPDSTLTDGIDVAATLRLLRLDPRSDVSIHGPDGEVIASTEGLARRAPLAGSRGEFGWGRTLISDFLAEAGTRIGGLWDGRRWSMTGASASLRDMVTESLSGATRVEIASDVAEGPGLVVAAPILRSDRPVGVAVVTTGLGEIHGLVRAERERAIQVLLVAVLVSIGLSLVLASTIATPLAQLAAATDIGRDRQARSTEPERVRIPDLTSRGDEIGRLSGSLRGMVAALYDRIDGNEQFAADVAHEIKNPLASLRSAVGSLRIVSREDHRARLLDVIEHDVRRLDRLVSDISNASRLDSELVREAEEGFDLVPMLRDLGDHLGRMAGEMGIAFVADLPQGPILLHGLQSRLAQVFVNLITNAISFCEEDDIIRIWARQRENRVLIVVEDTGPGIPESALGRIFERFYSERPEGQFGDNSGLGLAISKQIVEAHGGVIWAENMDGTARTGARFVVGLPL